MTSSTTLTTGSALRRAAQRTRARVQIVLVAGVVAVIGLASALGTGAQQTSAAWNDSVWFGGAVTTAAGTAPPTGGGVGGLTPGPGVTFPGGTPTWTGTDTSLQNACATVTVATTSTTPLTWSVRLDTWAAPWNGATSGYNLQWPYTFSGGLVDGRYLTIVGSPSNPYPSGSATIVAGANRTFQLCLPNPGAPQLGESSWFSTVWTDPLHASADQVCRTVTVAGLQDQLFWFRWQATLDTTSMFAELGTQHSSNRPFSGYGWSYSDWNVTRTPGSPAATPTAPTQFTFGSALNDTTSMLRMAKSFSYTVCLTGY